VPETTAVDYISTPTDRAAAIEYSLSGKWLELLHIRKRVEELTFAAFRRLAGSVSLWKSTEFML
jgi:hypothetical protein